LMGSVGDGVGLHPGDQVVVAFEQADDDLAGGIVVLLRRKKAEHPEDSAWRDAVAVW
jgi:hypothetical protein